MPAKNGISGQFYLISLNLRVLELNLSYLPLLPLHKLMHWMVSIVSFHFSYNKQYEQIKCTGEQKEEGNISWLSVLT